MSETTTEPTPETEAPEAPETEAPAEETAPESEKGEKGEPSFEDRLAAAEKVNKDLERKLQRSADNRQRVSELEAEVAKLQGKESEFAEVQKQREAEQAALAKANDRIRRSEVKAAAKGVLADPADAYKFLDLDSFEVGDDGDVDEAAIADALANLVKSKPYLAAQGGRKFQGTADGGARKGPTQPSQLSEADVKRLSSEGRHDEIVKAKAEGRLNDYLAS